MPDPEVICNPMSDLEYPNAESSQACEPPGKRNVCNCFQVTCEDMQRILVETNGASFETLKEYYQLGSRCTSCEYEIKDLVTVYREEQQQARLTVGGAGVPLGRRVGAWYRRLKRVILRRITVRRYAIFVIRRPGYESSLTLSNLAFPEDPRNVNGSAVSFRVTLFDLAGRVVAQSGSMELPTDRSGEYWLHELFPSVEGDITGMMFVDYPALNQVGSLRPYCCFNFGRRGTEYRGRWHYHDKYGVHPYNGHFHCNHPLFPGQECWMAISNCTDHSYQSTACLRFSDGQIVRRPVELPAFGSLWVKVEDFFGAAAVAHRGDGNSLLWLEDNSRLMVWFFWHKTADNLWLVQHH